MFGKGTICFSLYKTAYKKKSPVAAYQRNFLIHTDVWISTLKHFNDIS